MPLTPTSSRAGTGIPESLLDAKGDLIAASAADTAARLAVGADGSFLRALASEASGLAWQAGVRLVELFDETKGADAATFDTGAGGFVTTLDHLLLVAQLRTTEALTISAALLTLNNDAGANYDMQALRGRNATVSALASVAGANCAIPTAGASDAGGVFGPVLVLIPDYAQTTAEKVFFALSGHADETAANSNAELRLGHWRSTVAVSRIILTANAGTNFLTGSRLTVYGLG